MSTTTIDISFPGNKKVDAKVGTFVVKTDQSVKEGGEGTAPEPYAHFLASIGTCAGVYVLAFCGKRDIRADGIRIRQTVQRSKDKKRLERVDVDILVPPEFPEKYYGALARAADQCAVKKAILDPPEFQVRTLSAD